MDKNRKSHIVFGDSRDRYNRGMWVSATKCIQNETASASLSADAITKRQEENEKINAMKKKLQTASLVLGNASDDETTWSTSSSHAPASVEEQAQARGQLDPAVQRRIKMSNVKLGCKRVQTTNYTSVSHAAHSKPPHKSAATLEAERKTAKAKKHALTSSSIDSW